MFHFLFFLLLLGYFAVATDDVVCYYWSSLFGRPVASWPWGSALLLSGLLTWGLGYVVRMFHRKKLPVFPVYVAASMLLALLFSLPWALCQSVLVLILGGVLICGLHACWMKRLERIWPSRRSMWQEFLPPAVRFLVLTLYLGIGTALQDTEHYELRSGQALSSSRPEEAYTVGERSLAVSPRLFAMRCYLMATTDQRSLGETFFQQPIPGAHADLMLLPDDRRQNLLFPASRQTDLLGSRQKKGEAPLAYLRRCAYQSKPSMRSDSVASAAADYYLCALLLEGRIDDFARAVKDFYPKRLREGNLPRYYAQAMVIYTRLRTRPVAVYRDAVTEANLHDYMEMEAKTLSATARYHLMRLHYGETYWWWADYAIPSFGEEKS